MKKLNSNFILIWLLIGISLGFYLIQLFVFNSPRDTAFYLLQDLAFLPLQVVIVTLVLNKLISAREKQERLKKMNMAINAFFGEAGTDMLLSMNLFVTNPGTIKTLLDFNGKWNEKDFQKSELLVAGYDFQINSRNGDILQLKNLLIDKRTFLMSMLENSNLLEHDTFTEMLWSVFHIMDELVARLEFSNLPDADLDHLSLDIKRAYKSLLVEWIHYIKHLKTDYPYLFSMAVRKNPFDDNRSVIFK